MIWKVKTTEPTTTFDVSGSIKMTGYNTLEIMCDEVDIRDGVMIFYNWEDDNSEFAESPQKAAIIAMFPIHNLVSVIKEESD